MGRDTGGKLAEGGLRQRKEGGQRHCDSGDDDENEEGEGDGTEKEVNVRSMR